VTVTAPLTRIQQRPAWPAASPRQFEGYEWRRRRVGTLVIKFCPTLGGVRRLFDDRGFGGSYISRAFENYVVNQLSRDKNPSAPVLRAGKESAVGQSVDVSLAAGKQHRSLLGVYDRAEPRCCEAGTEHRGQGFIDRDFHAPV
jgi:hypothetical protein